MGVGHQHGEWIAEHGRTFARATPCLRRFASALVRFHSKMYPIHPLCHASYISHGPNACITGSGPTGPRSGSCGCWGRTIVPSPMSVRIFPFFLFAPRIKENRHGFLSLFVESLAPF